MSNLRKLRIASGLKLREVAQKVGVTASTVHDAEVRGLRTVNAAERYAVAFPGKSWFDLLDSPGDHTSQSLE